MQSPQILVHVGLHKCASTWLQKNVLSRADFGIQAPWGEMSHIAVTEFVDVDPLCFDAVASRSKFYAALDKTGSSTSVAAISHEALSSRPHHGKYYAPYTAERLAFTFPNAKVFLIFREQSGIIYSLYGEHVRNGGRNSFDEFLGDGNERPGWAPLCKLSFFEYDRLVNMYQGLFGTDNVLALPLEMLNEDPEAFLTRFFSFLDLPVQSPDAEKKTNKGWGALTVELYRLTNGIVRKHPLGTGDSSLYRFRQFVAWRIDRVLPAAWSKAVERRRRATLAARIDGVFSESNARLSKLLGLDLKALGYK